MGGLDDIDLDEAGWEDEEDDEDADGPGFLGGMGFGFAGLPGFLGGGAMPQASRQCVACQVACHVSAERARRGPNMLHHF
jgi:hypothetical protein